MTMFCSIWNDRCEDIFVDIAVFISDSGGGKFAEKSSTEQWLQRGGEFMNHSLYEVAAKCFNRGKNYHMEKIAKAYQSALLASRFVFFLLCKHLKFIGIWRRMIKKIRVIVKKEGESQIPISIGHNFLISFGVFESCCTFMSFLPCPFIVVT